MSKIKVTFPATFMDKYQTFDASRYEIYMSTNGVLVIRNKGGSRIIKAFAEGQWLTAEVV